MYPITKHQDGSLCIFEQLNNPYNFRSQLLMIRQCHAFIRCKGRQHALVHEAILHIQWNIQPYWAGTPASSLVICQFKFVFDFVGIKHHAGIFRDRFCHGDIVAFLRANLPYFGIICDQVARTCPQITIMGMESYHAPNSRRWRLSLLAQR